MPNNLKQHCLHHTGQGTSWGHGGSTDYYCCYCDKRIVLKWELEHRQLLGHGPFGKEAVQVMEKQPDASCPSRGV